MIVSLMGHWGIEQGRQCQPVFINGGGVHEGHNICRRFADYRLFRIANLCPAARDLQEVMNAINALGARENELLSKKDAAGIASLFTSDGLLVMLAPQFAFRPGRDAIQKHYQGIIDAGATSITLELKNLELRGNDGVWAAGNYSVTVKDKTIQGNWFRILKRESGTWKIAMEAFARAGAIDAPPASTGPSPAPTGSK